MTFSGEVSSGTAEWVRELFATAHTITTTTTIITIILSTTINFLWKSYCSMIII